MMEDEELTFLIKYDYVVINKFYKLGNTRNYNKQ